MTSSQMPLTAGKPGHRWWILAVLATAQLMVALDATAVSIALRGSLAGARRTGGGAQLHRRVLGRSSDLDSRGIGRRALAATGVGRAGRERRAL